MFVRYVYDTPDLLDGGKAYMYPPFMGSAFLDAYHESRRACLERLSIRFAEGAVVAACRLLLERLGEGLSPAYEQAAEAPHCPEGFHFPGAQGPAGEFFAALPNRQIIETRQLVLQLLSAFGRRDDVSAVVVLPWVVAVAARFDITGRLHEGYGQGLRGGQGAANRPATLAQAALAVACWAVRNRDLRALNALLKMGDRICSDLSAYGHPDAAAIAAHSLLLETRLVAEVLDTENRV